MTELKTKTAPLLDQQLALAAYLDALLQPAPAVVPPVPAVDAAVVVSLPTAPPATPAPVPPPAAAEPAPLAVPSPPPAASTGCPVWAAGGFQALLFTVGGLSLALPLERLHGVVPWEDGTVTPMPGHGAGFIGLLPRLGRQVKVFDTAQVVLPADRHAALGPADARRLGRIILIDEGRWGLACDSVADVVTLAPDHVKWRGAGGRRPWLAGTIIQHMCALLDAAALAQLLEVGEAGT